MESHTVSNIVLFDYSNLAHRCVASKAGLPGWQARAFEEMYDFVLDVAASNAADCTQVVVALDSKAGYWRRDIFQPYKADRKRRRDDSVDWDEVFRQFDEFAERIARHLPWAVLRVDKCEADDIIYALVNKHAGSSTSCYIYSSDADYLMLCGEHARLYNPMRGAWASFPYDCKVNGKDFRYETPAEYKMYAILTGQAGKDNVYNIRTPTDFSGPRKPGFGVAAAAKLIADATDCGLYEALQQAGLYDNYMRNRTLIDPQQLPKGYGDAIIGAYDRALPHMDDIPGFLSEIGSRMNPDEVQDTLGTLFMGTKQEDPGFDTFESCEPDFVEFSF